MLAPFTCRDGEILALYEWPFDDWNSQRGGLENPRGAVLIVHGLGEHAFRYDALANRLMNWGFAVRGYDQRGHGQSSGGRGLLPDNDALLDDLVEIVDDTRERCLQLPNGRKGLPLILLGHSMGGLIASRFVSLAKRPVEGLVLSSPAFNAGLAWWQKATLALLHRIAPNASLPNGLDAQCISHDRVTVERYLADPLVHNRVSPRLARFIDRTGPQVIAAANNWQVPTLLLYAGEDKLVDPAGSRAFAQGVAASPAAKPNVLKAKCFDALYHELFNERAAEALPVFNALQGWLDERFV
jgi:alpha-beta hydrolase superfamily lysophospholipase